MSLLKSIKFCYPDAKIVLCFFHFMQNHIKKLPEIRNKNKVLKNYAKDLLANVRLICFINLNKIESFYESMKTKYRTKFPIYFKYFDKNYINNNARFNKIWNYNEFIYNNLNNDMLFFTNNICESMNRTLNSKYIVGCKTFYSFKNSILDIIDFYTNKIDVYQERNVSITRSLEYYVKIKLIINLINNDSLKAIKKEYKDFLVKNKYPFNQNNYDSDSLSNYEKKKPFFINSSDSESEEEIIENEDNSNDNNSSSEDDINDNKNEIKINNKKIIEIIIQLILM